MYNFVYSGLDESKQQIRVLTLLPGRDDDALKGYLRTVSIDCDPIPAYEALSYVWGSTEHMATMAIRNETASESSNEDQVFSSIAITQNLLIALPYLRYPDKLRHLWIDALCINQKDLAERSSQVQRMHDIFNAAQNTILWLGSDPGSATIAFNRIAYVTTLWTYDHHMEELSVNTALETAERELAEEYSITYTLDEIEALADLIHNPYFYRVWVFQEVQLANTASVLQWGTHCTSWTTFCQYIGIMLHTVPKCKINTDEELTRYDRAAFRLQDYNHIRMMTRECSGYRLEKIFDSQKHSQCADPRDRIYGMLFHLSQQSLGQVVDYTRQVHEIYRELAEGCYKSVQRFDLLQSCWLSNQYDAMPSWVPDWSRPKPTMNMTYSGHAYTYNAYNKALIHGDILKTQGITLGVVQKCASLTLSQPAPMNPEVLRSILKALKDLDLDLAASYGVVGTTGSISEAIVSLIRQERFGDLSAPPLRSMVTTEDLPQLGRLLQKCMKYPQNKFDTEEVRPLAGLYETLAGRSFASTSSGYLGLVPDDTLPGDYLVSLIGSHSSYVLRPATSGQFRVVGQAWTAGATFAEPFLGPLPSNVKAITNITNMEYVFLDTNDGKILDEDPRTRDVEVPKDWIKLESDLPEHRLCFGHRPSGWAHYSYDPRFTAEEFKKRGMKIEDFDII